VKAGRCDNELAAACAEQGELLSIVGKFHAAGRLSVRVGLRWEAEVPLGWIEAAEEVAGRGAKRDARAKGREKSELVAVVMGEPNVRLRLGREVEVIGLFGMRRRVRETWVRVDEPARFCAAVNAGGEVECEAAGR